MDYDFVTTRLATGAAINNDEDVQILIKFGITHIINCRSEFDDAPLLLKHPQIKYLYNPTYDDGTHKSAEWFCKSIVFALEALGQSVNKVYVHCAAGINRGPSSAFAILRALGLSSTQSESFIKIARPMALIAYMNDANAAISLLKYE